MLEDLQSNRSGQAMSGVAVLTSDCWHTCIVVQRVCTDRQVACNASNSASELGSLNTRSRDAQCSLGGVALEYLNLNIYMPALLAKSWCNRAL